MRSLRALCLLLAVCLLTPFALAQVRTVGQIVGVVTDPTGAVVPGAQVVAVDEGTGLRKETTSGEDGKFVFPDLNFGTYRITVTMQGFRTAVYPGVKVEVGLTANVTVKLEIGTTAETITVEAGTDVLQTTAPTIESSVTGRVLRNVPLNNRDVLDFVMLMPGAQQAGVARQATFLGLPKGAINISMDGLNVQDNLLKSAYGGGMFTMIRPKLDNVEEITVSSAVTNSDSAGEGAVQIRFVTRRGTNDYHGSGFWYYRHDWLNANTWINNAGGLARNKNRLHQYGFNLGGPFIKDKVFFFFSYEDFRLPEGRQRNNRVLTLDAQQGIFTYKPSATQAANPAANVTCDTGTAPNQICRASLLAIAGAVGLPSTLDPLTQSMLNTINPIVAGGRTTYDLFRDRYIYSAVGGQRRWFPTLRLDWNITEKLRWHGVANFNRFNSSPDTLNRMDPSFPGTGFEAGQYSNRASLTTALNWDIRPNMTYELRVGRQSGMTLFFPETEPTPLGSPMFPGGYRAVWPLGLTSLHARPSETDGVGTTTTRSFPAPRTTPVLQWGNNLGWLKGKHSLNFGTNLTVITAWSSSFGSAGIPTVDFGIPSADSAATAALSSTTIPGIVTTPDLGNARSLYAMLTGRINSVSGSNNVDEITKQYKTLASLTNRDRMNEFGVYVSDSWRAFPSLTVTAGLRWELQGSPYNRNGIYTSPTYEDIWGKSGVGNLFMPGTLSGNPNPQVQLRSRGFHKRFLKAWAPNIGLAWQPKVNGDWYKWIFGGPSKSVFRAGYSIAYTREGFSHFSAYGSNAGGTQSIFATSGTDFTPGALLRNGLPALKTSPATFSFPVPMSNFTFANSMWTYDPNLTPPYVQSFSLGWQREITPTTVVEVRYVGNHGTRLWRGININEVNIFESGFLNEFRLAKQNLDLNKALGCGTRFDPRPGCSTNALPLLTAAFSAVPGTPTGTFASAVSSTAGFSSTTFIQYLDEGQAGRFANSLATSATYLCRLAGSQLTGCSSRNLLSGVPVPLGVGLYPSNIFMVNPDLAGFTTDNLVARVLTNNGNSTYHGLQMEVRRRMAKGLMIQASYSFSKSLTDRFDDSDSSASSFYTLRNPGRDKGVSPYDLRHTVRLYWIYELPFGPGRKWSSANAVVNRFIEGWEFLGVIGLQSGRPFQLTSDRQTVNQYDAGVIPMVSRKELQNLVKIVKVAGRKYVYFVDPQLIGTGAATPPTSGTANPAFLTVPTTPGELGQLVFLTGPKFFKPDFTIAKTTSVTEKVKLQFRAEFFNAVNYTNWMVGSPTGAAITQSIQSTSWGQTTSYLNDLGNQDQGPRMIQFVMRISF